MTTGLLHSGPNMNDALTVDTADWSLLVRCGDNTNRLALLMATMQRRGAAVPATDLIFAPPVNYIGNDDPVSKLSCAVPIFFENQLYHFEFSFRENVECSTRVNFPKITHRLSAIEDAFYFSKKSPVLAGSLNFANDIGWVRLKLEYWLKIGKTTLRRVQSISFEVFPTKVSMGQDLAKIHSTIDAAFPLWRFSFAKRTEIDGIRARPSNERFSLFWLANFKSLRSRLENGVKLVISVPHARLVENMRDVKLHKLKGRLTPKIEARAYLHLQLGEDHHRYGISKKRLSVDTTENRFVKMALVSCSREISAILKLARTYQNEPDEGGRLSASFFNELADWATPLNQLVNQPFFSEIGVFSELSTESLVLHQKAGYCDVYKVWQELKTYIGLFGHQASVSMKSVADLYEVWCFLELKNQLVSLGFIETSYKKSGLKGNGFEMHMRKGDQSAVVLERHADGLVIALSHEPTFGTPANPKKDPVYSWTTVQKPDIVLKASFANGKVIRWVFDAKYRIEIGDESGPDMAPDDAINQMHRYRDALIQLSRFEGGYEEKSRPILGAFVLYPGWFNERNCENPYIDSIAEVGIGAFPLLPTQPNLWLRNFLACQLGDPQTAGYKVPESDRFFAEEASRITVTGSYLSHYRDLAIVANLAYAGRDKNYIHRFQNGAAEWYHIPVDTTKKRVISQHVMRETRYCAIVVKEPSVGIGFVAIQWIYEVSAVSIVRRCALSVEQAGKLATKEDEYWLLKLELPRRIIRPIVGKNLGNFVLLHTSAQLLNTAVSFDQLLPRYTELVSKN